MALADPVYLAIVDDDTLRTTISKGRPGTAMSAFAQKEGGMLTDEQVNAIIHGIRERWSKPDALAGVTAPPYAAKRSGQRAARRTQFTRHSAQSCHGTGGKGGPKAGSVTNPSYLSLISDQGLRTIVIAGRPDFGAPDWRGNLPGHPMTNRTDYRRGRVAGGAATETASQQAASALPSSPGGTQVSDQDNNAVSRRDLFAKIGMLLNGLAVVILATPVVGYLVSPDPRRRPRSVQTLGRAGGTRRISRRPDSAREVSEPHRRCL